jgi:flagellar hook assembly protein FlgD
MRGGGRLVIDSPADQEASVSVVDLRGRVVRSLGPVSLAAGLNTLPWDGRNAAGSRVSQGVYFLVVRTPAAGASGKLMVLR